VERKRSEWLQRGMEIRKRVRMKNKDSVITAVQQQDYSASVWLRRRDKLEHSQQKCIVIFALVCCFAVLVALIFSAVDIWGEDEDGITEDNCSRNCRVVLVENIPEDISFLDNATSHLPLSAGLYSLLDKAIRAVEIVSPLWLLNSSDYESSFQPGRALLSRLQGLKAKGVQLKISSGMIDSTELKILAKHCQLSLLLFHTICLFASKHAAA
uniref:PLD phosphodiesterase domain-containing protein n=1 Tax=Amphiprion percula TaxID=161767 RepID=A0A3P8RSD4_AMPPE